MVGDAGGFGKVLCECSLRLLRVGMVVVVLVKFCVRVFCDCVLVWCWWWFGGWFEVVGANKRCDGGKILCACSQQLRVGVVVVVVWGLVWSCRRR